MNAAVVHAANVAVVVNILRAMTPVAAAHLALNVGAAVLQNITALNDTDLIAVVNRAFAIALADGRGMVVWADIVQAYEAWLAGDV
ncbi:hypothetical protein SCHPADRAFT_1003458 [Schizopora paradoxa]|uniref:Uncharacterized protein n=1 Tax=Schizopora paradoxa TaxID=27342 RepID=A0A0H2R322_9AGAM|nr:hypothetical protein SCHPADRAFT_1003458 [Schizopora paradoxa]